MGKDGDNHGWVRGSFIYVKGRMISFLEGLGRMELMELGERRWGHSYKKPYEPRDIRESFYTGNKRAVQGQL